MNANAITTNHPLPPVCGTFKKIFFVTHVWSIKEKKARAFDCKDIFRTVNSRKRHEILVFQLTTPLKIALKENCAAMEKRNRVREINDLSILQLLLSFIPLLLSVSLNLPLAFLIEKNMRNSWESKTVSSIQNLCLCIWQKMYKYI